MEAMGVPTANVEITDFGGRRTLIVERFDRLSAKDGRLLRLPQEYTCQALSIPATRKYQADGGPGMREIINLFKGSDTPGVDVRLFMRACILFWLLGAADGHAKNFSIFIGPGGRFRMTPLYDVLSAQPILDERQISRKKFKLAMSVGRKRHYTISDVVPQTAELAGVGIAAMNAIFEDIVENAELRAEAAIAALPLDFPDQLVTSIMAALSHRIRLVAASLS
jgi:serine/threonine-protein kinase HipA